MTQLRQISNQKFLQELQKRVWENQITSDQLAQILKESVNRVAKSQEEQQEQAAKDYEEWANDPAEWEVDEKEEWN
jgi:maltodextrin utilization protein YvdJ